MAGKPIRNPQRVQKAIKEALKQFPDLRVGQLITNAAVSVDLFYIEDDLLARDIEQFCQIQKEIEGK